MAQQQTIEQDAAARWAEPTVVPTGLTPHADPVAAVRELLGDGPTVAEQLNAARALHAAAVRRLEEARQFERWPTYAYKGAPLRDDALDDLHASVDTLLAAMAVQAEAQRDTNANIAGLLELIVALIPEAD